MSHKAKIVKPLLLAISDLELTLEQPNLILESLDNGLMIHSVHDRISFICDKDSLKKRLEKDSSSAMLLQKTHCIFNLKDEKTHWIVTLKLDSAQSDYQGALHRVFFVPKGDAS